MTIDTAIIQMLLADAPVVAIVGDSIWPGSKPQASGYPAIVVNWIEGNPVYTNDGDSGLNNVRLELNCYGETYTQAKDLAVAVKVLLSGFQGANSGISIENTLIASERDFRESGSNADEYLFRVNLDLEVWFR